MSIRVGLRPMGRRLALPVGPWPMEPLEYVFTEGTASPYDVMYDTIGGVGPISISTSEKFDATLYGGQRKLVRLSDGTLYAIYVKILAGKYQIYVKQSADDGATWTNDTRISTYAGMESYGHKTPCIAVDSDDCLHVVWAGMATGYATHEQIWYVKYDGSWGTITRISTYAGMATIYQYLPSIAVDSDDNLHVVWHGKGTGYLGYTQIWYVKYDGSWGVVTRISTYANMATKAQGNPAIAIGSSNHLHVVWQGEATGYSGTPDRNQIWYRKYTDSWGTVIRISTYAGMDTVRSDRTSIAVDSDDHVHVVWMGKATGYGNYQIWYAEGVPPHAVANWVTPVRISTYANMATAIQQDPSIAVDSDDHLHVLWEGKATGYIDQDKVWYNVYTDAWAGPTCLQPIGKNVYPNLRWSRWPR